MKMKKTKKTKAVALKCECGGTLEGVTLKNFDFSAYAGLPVVLAEAPGYRCTGCAGETPKGEVVNLGLIVLAIDIAQSTERLSSETARYLRRFLGVTQQELANRMGLARETVAKWECGETEISPQSDMILRVLALRATEVPEFPQLSPASQDAMRQLSAVRTAPPTRSKLPHPLAIKQYLDKAHGRNKLVDT